MEQARSRIMPKMTESEWLQWRRGGLGGSDAAAIMEVSPWCTRFQKFEEKVYGVESEDNAAKAFGRAKEEGARRDFEKLMGKSFFPTNLERTDIPWLKASLDGLTVSGLYAVEIKKTSREDHELAKKGQVTPKYFPQCQHILNVVPSLETFYFYSSPADGSKGAVVEVARENLYIEEQLFPTEQRFWDLVLSQEPPELTDRDYLSMEDNRSWKKVGRKILDVREQIKILEATDKDLVAELKALAGNRSAQGHGIRLQKQICRGAVDYSKIPELEGVDLAPYRKKSFEKWPVRAM